MHEYTRCLAVQLRPYNVRVNVVAPGDTVTPRFVHSRAIDDAMMVADGTLERYGWPREVAETVAFLASPRSLLHHRPGAARRWRQADLALVTSP